MPAPAATLAAVILMHKACREHGFDLATAALQHSVRDPRITAGVVGFSTPARLERLIAVLETQLPPEVWDRLAELLPDEHHWLEGT
jgi:D-threo-aldose 1-dehydrogenase